MESYRSVVLSLYIINASINSQTTYHRIHCRIFFEGLKLLIFKISKYFQPYINFKTGRKQSQPDGVRGTVRRHQTEQHQVTPYGLIPSKNAKNIWLWWWGWEWIILTQQFNMIQYNGHWWHFLITSMPVMSANFIIRLNSSQLRESKHQTQSGVISRELPAPPTPAPVSMIIILIARGKFFLYLNNTFIFYISISMKIIIEIQN